MTIEQAIVERVKRLPPEKQREVLDFTDSLQAKVGSESKPARRSLEGALAHLGVNVTEEDIAEARREMCGNFPREFPPKDEP